MPEGIGYNKRKDFDYIIENAPEELSQIYSKQEGRNHFGLYSFVDETGVRRFVEATADEWYRKKDVDVKDALFGSASKNLDAGQFVDGWEYYDSMTKRSIPEKVMDWWENR